MCSADCSISLTLIHTFGLALAALTLCVDRDIVHFGISFTISQSLFFLPGPELYACTHKHAAH